MTSKERKRNDDLNDFFSTFDEEFEEMRVRMDMMMQNMLTERPVLGIEPSVYGVSMRVGMDGIPHMHEFGNMPRPAAEEEGAALREPLTDVIEEKDKVRVIMELPGVERDEIVVNAEDKELFISVDTESRKFSKNIDLPCRVRSESAIASYKNGVLSITMDREPPKRRKKRTIVEPG
jgi:HSP20 family protein